MVRTGSRRHTRTNHQRQAQTTRRSLNSANHFLYLSTLYHFSTLGPAPPDLLFRFCFRSRKFWSFRHAVPIASQRWLSTVGDSKKDDTQHPSDKSDSTGVTGGENVKENAPNLAQTYQSPDNAQPTPGTEETAEEKEKKNKEWVASERKKRAAEAKQRAEDFKKKVPKMKVFASLLPFALYWWYLDREEQQRVMKELDKEVIGALQEEIEHLIRVCKFTSFDVTRLRAQFRQAAAGGTLSPEEFARPLLAMTLALRQQRKKDYDEWIKAQAQIQAAGGEGQQAAAKDGSAAPAAEPAPEEEFDNPEGDDEYEYVDEDEHEGGERELDDCERSMEFDHDGPDRDDTRDVESWEFLCLVRQLPFDDARRRLALQDLEFALAVLVDDQLPVRQRLRNPKMTWRQLKNRNRDPSAKLKVAWHVADTDRDGALSRAELEWFMERLMRTGHFKPRQLLRRASYFPPQHVARQSADLAELYTQQLEQSGASVDRIHWHQFKELTEFMHHTDALKFWYYDFKHEGFIKRTRRHWSHVLAGWGRKLQIEGCQKGFRCFLFGGNQNLDRNRKKRRKTKLCRQVYCADGGMRVAQLRWRSRTCFGSRVSPHVSVLAAFSSPASPALPCLNDFASPAPDSVAAALAGLRGNLFLTGRPGTGKTTLLRDWAVARGRTVLLAATGHTALHLGGQTIHSFFWLLPKLIEPAQDVHEKSLPYAKRQLLRELDTIVIDEVSMVRADLLDAVDLVLKKYRKNNKAFGGVRLVLCGDLHQLAPIAAPDEEAILQARFGGQYFFHAPVFRQTEVQLLELKKVFRQTEARYLQMLETVRTGAVKSEDAELLRAKVSSRSALAASQTHTVLAPTNRAAHAINRARLDMIPQTEHVFNATVTGAFNAKAYPTLKSLSLKAGARVVLIKNGPDGRWVNGSIGTVASCDATRDVVTVRLEGQGDVDRRVVEVRQMVWEELQYRLDPASKEIKSQVVGKFE
eukprot:g78130.t1